MERLPHLAEMLRQQLPAFAGKIPTRRLPGVMVPLISMFDRSLRNSRAYLGVWRRYDLESGEHLLGRPLRSTPHMLTATAESLVERNLV